MARDDWFRSTTWNDQIEAAFNSKLERARKKDQYLRIQAHTLIETHPEVTLHLIERYFNQECRFFDASALDDRAKALARLGRLDEAYGAYESALKVESEFPGHKTTAFVDYPFLVATERAKQKYQTALEVLSHRAKDLAFPINKFRWNVAQALIFRDLGQLEESRGYAKAALEASALRHSEFQKHRSLGLVDEKDTSWIREMEEILGTRAKKRFFGLV